MIERLRRDRFFFGSVVVMLWVATFFLAVTWYLFRDPVSAAGTVMAVVGAIVVFRIREASK